MGRNISTTVIEASKVVLVNAVRVYGDNTYTVSTNFLSWDDNNMYSLEDIALTFGTRKSVAQGAVVGGSTREGFCCGNSVISAYDFGLLYTVFSAMIMAKVELGSTFPVENENTGYKGTRAVWFGNHGIAYSRTNNMILPLPTATVESACSGQHPIVPNFCTNDDFEVECDGNTIGILRVQGTEKFLVAHLTIPECVRRTYARYFKPEAGSTTADGMTRVESDSMLGQLIGEADIRTEALEALKSYRSKPSMDSVVVRDDLFVVPTERYQDTTNFYGSICYTDKEQVAMAVSFRRGLFVYYPWFPESPDDEGKERSVKTDSNAVFQSFYNVTEGCNRIMRFAETVTYRPLTAAKFDLTMYSKVREAFLEMSLPRVPIHSTFGRIVIPENVLIKELTTDSGESIYCLLPVGCVGSKVICLSAEGELMAVTPTGWNVDGAFYDITEVVL